MQCDAFISYGLLQTIRKLLLCDVIAFEGRSISRTERQPTGGAVLKKMRKSISVSSCLLLYRVPRYTSTELIAIINGLLNLHDCCNNSTSGQSSLAIEKWFLSASFYLIFLCCCCCSCWWPWRMSNTLETHDTSQARALGQEGGVPTLNNTKVS